MGNTKSVRYNFSPSDIIFPIIVHTDVLHELTLAPAVEYEDTEDSERKVSIRELEKCPWTL